jgi:hypothetical protein
MSEAEIASGGASDAPAAENADASAADSSTAAEHESSRPSSAKEDTDDAPAAVSQLPDDTPTASACEEVTHDLVAGEEQIGGGEAKAGDESSGGTVDAPVAHEDAAEDANTSDPSSVSVDAAAADADDVDASTAVVEDRAAAVDNEDGEDQAAAVANEDGADVSADNSNDGGAAPAAPDTNSTAAAAVQDAAPVNDENSPPKMFVEENRTVGDIEFTKLIGCKYRRALLPLLSLHAFNVLP